MASNLHFVRPAVWDRTFRRLTKDAKVVAFYVWTGPTRISEGLFQLAPGHVVADTGLSEEEVLAAFLELSAAGLIDYDVDAEVVLDRLALKRNPVRNGRDQETGEVRVDNRIKNALPRFAQVPESALKVEFVALADLYSPDLAAAIRSEGTYAYPPSVRDLEGTSKDPRRSRIEKNRVEGKKSRGESTFSQEEVEEVEEGSF